MTPISHAHAAPVASSLSGNTTVPGFNDFFSDVYDRSPYQDLVDAFLDMRPDTIPAEIWNGSCKRTFKKEFDVNEYFTLLNCIHPVPGSVLDYIYMGDDEGRRPLIYIRDRTHVPYTSFLEYLDEEGKTQFTFDIFFKLFRQYGGTIDWPWHMVIEDSRDGFFQFLLLTTMGSQFYLWGDANYDDLTMVCDTRGLYSIAEREPDFVREDPDFIAALNEACRFDLHPVIAMSEDRVMMTALFFTKWGGLVMGTFLVEREYPHTGIGSRWMTIVEYDCGINLAAGTPVYLEL